MSAETALPMGAAAVLGASLGSFLNVLIYRLPVHQPIGMARSQCRSCGRVIPWYDNLPILSYLLLRGRCRACHAPFSIRYPIVEALTALLAVALFAREGLSLAVLGAFYFGCSLIVLTYIDLDHRLLPDRITLPGIVLGLVLSVAAPRGGDRLASLETAVLGVLLGGGILWLVAWSYEKATGREGMGGGDIKLLAMIGAFLGWKGVLLTLLLSSLIGSMIGVGVMLARGANTRLAIPFGPFLAIGALIGLFWGEQIVAWYISTLGVAAT
jgi:leader peptidase (prepilin peptidase) / N-methyltransferase